MSESSTNILNLSESALNLLKKLDLVQKILDLKGKVGVDTDVHKLCGKIERLTGSLHQIVAENKKLQSDIVIVKNVNHTLEEMGEQCSHRNNREISGIPNSIPGKDLENTVISICNDSGVEIDQKDIEGCHRLPLSRNSSGQY